VPRDVPATVLLGLCAAGFVAGCLSATVLAISRLR
jgi:hypothetical protein